MPLTPALSLSLSLPLSLSLCEPAAPRSHSTGPTTGRLALVRPDGTDTRGWRIPAFRVRYVHAPHAKGRTPKSRGAALRLWRLPGAYLRIRLRSTYCMMPPLR
jgi:hypothetical protein